MAGISVTPAAAAKIKQHAERSEGEGAALRVSVSDGGCAGMRYQLQIDSEIGPRDLLSEQHGARVVVDVKSAIYLGGSTLDYLDTLNESGFKITNPNATSTCSCGDSFGT